MQVRFRPISDRSVELFENNGRKISIQSDRLFPAIPLHMSTLLRNPRILDNFRAPNEFDVVNFLVDEPAVSS
jgi:hypothetical protein